MSWNVWVVDTVTGLKQQCLPVSDFGWSRVLNGGGSGSATVQLRDAAVRQLNIKPFMTLVKYTLVLEWRALFTPVSTAVVVYAGIMWANKYHQPSGTLVIQHADLWSMLARRLAVSHLVGDVAVWAVTYTGVSLRQFAKDMVLLGITGHENSNIPLPITLPADETGSITRTISGYHLPNLAESLDDLMNEEGGPDIDFRPRWVDDKLDWQMRCGSTINPKLTSGLWEWNLGAEQSGVVGLTVTEDSVNQVTNMIAIGEGTEEDMLVRSNRIVDPPIPHMERVEAHKGEPDAIRLAALATGDLNAHKTPTTEWGFSILAGGTPAVSSLVLGGTAKVWVEDRQYNDDWELTAGDDWIDGGYTSSRLIEFSGNLTENVQLQFQPDGGV